MCGIAGFINFKESNSHASNHLEKALQRLAKRGPDANGIHRDNNCELGHTRLSIIDTSSDANQPMKDSTGRYVLIFNGEIYNYLELKKDLELKGSVFKTDSDTEVLLIGLIKYGAKFIQKLNGFFSFCFYDSTQKYYLLARDRFGIKPLIYSKTAHHLIFGSELKAVLAFEINKDIDHQAIAQYFRHTYIPAPRTILKSCKKLLPGHYIESMGGNFAIKKYYDFYPSKNSDDDYLTAQKKIKDLLHQSVQKRLVSDVPLGTFLSGGVDSSIISAVAKEYKNDLNTFSLGFPDEPLFDESKYAQKVAKHINSNHHCFQVTKKEIYQNLEDILDYLDEPMADSSAINVYILSQQTKNNVTVSLSGDGADELFSGYNKHQALFFSLQNSLKNKSVKYFGKGASLLPSSRNSKVGNFGRQIEKLHVGLNKEVEDRYLEWASFMDLKNTQNLTGHSVNSNYLNTISSEKDQFNNFLFYDFNLVLENDMLRKVDLMSMANSLEVRTPFLDHELVNYVFAIPSSFKIDKKNRKKILKDTFEQDLPKELFNRKKHGFEVPLKKWFNDEMKLFLEENIFNNNKLVKEGILKKEGVNHIYKLWKKNSPGNTVYHIWSLIVLNNFFQKYIYN
jgi:asparagine synthase (glutamine-hydrolysing)